MRVPSLQQWAHWSQGAGLMIAGMVIGAAVFMAIHQHVLNAAMEENARLKIENQLLRDNHASKEQYNKNPRVINSIIVLIETDPKKDDLDELTKSELRSRVRKDLSVLLGKQVVDITPMHDNGTRLLKTLYEQLHSDVNGKDYLVNIENYHIVFGELRVWIHAKEFKPKTG